MNRRIVVLVAAAVLGVLVVWAMAPKGDGPAAVEVRHFDSIPTEGGNFEEVFRIDLVREPLDTANITVIVSELVTNVTWEPAGAVHAGTLFRFPLDAFDFLRLMELRQGDRLLWKGEFGSGSGTPVVP